MLLHNVKLKDGHFELGEKKFGFSESVVRDGVLHACAYACALVS